MTSIENSDLPLVHALWIGEKLGPVAAACLRSFKRAGHAVVLHSYSDVADLPAGIQASDAALIVPRNRIIRHRKTGSFALFSNLFRYELLRREPVLWTDCDVFCVRPIDYCDYLMGFERDGVVNTAVLSLPSGSSILADLIEAANNPILIPPWISDSKAAKFRLLRCLGLHGVDKLPWGSLGPKALTYLVEKHGLLHKAVPPDVFYPVDMDRLALLFDPDLSISDLLTHRTRCIHLYNEKLRRMDMSTLPESSPLGRMLSA